MERRRKRETLRPRKSPSQARSRETVNTILKAAAQVFAKRGYAGTTTNHIAVRAGVSIGSLYEYFPSKDALLIELLERHLADGEAVLERVWEGVTGRESFEDLVRRFATAMFELHAHDTRLHRLLFEEAPLPAATRRRLQSIEEAAAQRIETYLRANPKLSRRDPHLAATVIVQCIEGISHRLVVHGSEDTTPYVDEMVALVTGYLAAS